MITKLRLSVPQAICCFVCFFIMHQQSWSQTISSFSPSVGAVGTVVTINGSSLGNPTAVTIGGTNAVIVSSTATKVVALVMPGAVTGSVSVTTGGGTGVAGSNFMVKPTPYPKVQDNVIIDTSFGHFRQGWVVALSADGNTLALIGDQTYLWVYAKNSSNVWVKQARQVTPSAAGDPNSRLLVSLGISADGNTLVVGGPSASPTNPGTLGYAWIFNRSGSTWSETQRIDGPTTYFGTSAGISADGSTAVIGGAPAAISADGNTILTAYMDATYIYANNNGSWTAQSSIVQTNPTPVEGGGNQGAYACTRSGNTWTEQANIHVMSSSQVALNADGKTAIIGGAAFAFSGSAWALQQALGGGSAVSLSADGNTVLFGDYTDSSNLGAANVFTRTGGVWSRQNPKLTITRSGTPSCCAPFAGKSVSLSADGATGIIGAPYYGFRYGNGDVNDAYQAGGSFVFINSTVQDINACSSNLPYHWNGKDYSTEGTYTIHLTGSGGIDSAVTLILHIQQNTAHGIIPRLSANDTFICPGNLSALKVTTPKTKTVYTFSIDGGAHTQTSNIFKAHGGVYTASVFNSGCIVGTTNSVTVHQPSAKLALATAINADCSTGNGTITATAAGSYGDYMYKLNTGAYQASNVFTVTPGTYTVTVKDSEACVLDKTVTIGALTGELKISRPELCYGETGQLHVAVTNGTSPYQYSLDGTTFQASPNFTRHAGTYTATVMDAAGCTITTNSAALTQPAAPVTASYSVQNVSCSGGNDGSITVNASGGYSTSYTYRTGNNAFQPSNMFTALTAGTYKVSTRDARNCTIFKNIVVKPSSTPCFAATDATADALSKTGSTATDLKVTVFPNPGVTDFNLVIQGGDINKPVDVRVTDMLGKTIYQAHGTTSDTYRFGNRFAGGMYIAEITNGKNVQRLKLVKGR